MPRQPFSKLCSRLLCTYFLNELPEQGPTKARLRILSITQVASTGVGTLTICLRLIKSSLPSLYPLSHSCKWIIPAAIYHFSILQVMESWVGPGNEAMYRRICFSQYQASSAVARNWGLHLMYQVQSGDFITLIPITNLEQDTWWNLTHTRPPWIIYHKQPRLKVAGFSDKWMHAFWVVLPTLARTICYHSTPSRCHVHCIIKDAWLFYGPDCNVRVRSGLQR